MKKEGLLCNPDLQSFRIAKAPLHLISVSSYVSGKNMLASQKLTWDSVELLQEGYISVLFCDPSSMTP